MSEANPFTQDSFIKEATPAEIQLAISAGWDVNEPDPRYDETALMKAIHFQRLDLVPLLIEAGADVDYYPVPGGLPHALQLAVVEEQIEAVEFLLNAGADIDYSSKSDGTTALIAAAARGLPDMVRILLEYGADPTARTYKDAPPWQGTRMADMSARDFAVRYDELDIIDLLDAALAVHAGQPRKGCLHAGDKRFSDLAVRHFGDRDRWREIWELNDMKKGQGIKAGDCFLLPEK